MPTPLRRLALGVKRSERPRSGEALSAAAVGALQALDLGNAGALGGRQRYPALVLDVAAAVAEIGDRPLRLEAIAVRFVIGIALDPQLLAALGLDRRNRCQQALGNRRHRQQSCKPTHRAPPNRSRLLAQPARSIQFTGGFGRLPRTVTAKGRARERRSRTTHASVAN